MVAVSLYRPSLGLGGATLNVYSNCSGLMPPVMGMAAGPASRPVIVPVPSMLLLYSETIQAPPTTGVAAPVSRQLTLTSNSSSLSSSVVLSLASVGSSTSMPVTWPSRMPATLKSVTGVWSELDCRDMTFPPTGDAARRFRAGHRGRCRVVRVATNKEGRDRRLIHGSRLPGRLMTHHVWR